MKRILFLLFLQIIALSCNSNDADQNSDRESMSKEFEEHYELLKKSLALLKNANNISNELSSLKDADQIKTREMEMIRLMKEGIKIGKSVSDDFLQEISPEMVDHFKSKFIKGHEMLINGIQNSGQSQGVLDQQQGIELINGYFDWALNQNTNYEIL